MYPEPSPQALHNNTTRGTIRRPATDAIPSVIRYLVEADIEPRAEEVARLRRRAGRFLLATNSLQALEFGPAKATKESSPGSISLRADEALEHYKAQQGTERGFRFLKDPLFFTSSVFLHSPERVMALAIGTF